MNTWPHSAGRLRAMYASGKADRTARRYAKFWAAVFGMGLLPRRWVTLEVPGRKTGRITRFPLGMASVDGQRYLVPMLGGNCNWVRNVRAAGGLVTLRHGRAVRCRLTELPEAERPRVLKCFLRQVPGARPHLPVSKDASEAAFAAVAARYPVFLVSSLSRDPARSAPGRLRTREGGLSTEGQHAMTTQSRTLSASPQPPARPPRRHRHWGRWIAVGAAAVIVLVLAAVAAFVALAPSAAPLTLPSGAVSPPAGPLAGTWKAGAGSVAGFRVAQRALGFSSEVGGRTSDVTGTLVITGRQVASATFRIGLRSVTVGGRHRPQFAVSLGTRAHPVATFTLARPVTLSSRLAAGATVSFRAPGRLTLNGITRPVTAWLTARRDGQALQAAGSIPVEFAGWRIRQPQGFGPLGSLASRGDAEFRLVLTR